MRPRHVRAAGLVVLISIVMNCVAWGVPGMMNYQGQLTELEDTGLDGFYSIRFELFDDPSGGTLLWQEIQSVEVSNGIYHVQLGSVVPLNAGDFSGDEVYLGVSIYNDANSRWEMLTPRQQITSSAFALNSQTLEGYGSNDFAPAAHDHSGEEITSGTVDEARIDTDMARDSEIAWGNLAAIPSDIADGDDGITTEKDPTVSSAVKDGVSWGELSGIPSGFADNTDHVGITVESDPQIGANILSRVPKWNGSELVAGSIHDSGNIGIGTTKPLKKLHIVQDHSGLNYSLKLDNNALGSSTGILFSTGGDGGAVAPERGKGALVYEESMTWNRGQFHFLQNNEANTDNPDLSNKVMTIDRNGNVGIGTPSPSTTLEVNGLARVISYDWPSLGKGLEFAYNSASNRGYVQAFDRNNAQWGELYLGEGHVGIGPESDSMPSNNLYTLDVVQSPGSVYGAARFRAKQPGDYGGSFESTGNYGSAIKGYATGTDSAGVFSECIGDFCFGVFSGGTSYSFYAFGNGTDYGPFTGAHEVRLAPGISAEIPPGMIVSVTGRTEIRKQDDGKPSLSSTLPTVTLSQRAMDKAVLGVLVSENPLPKDHWYEAQEGDRFGIVNALGEGRMWVCDVEGDIEAGDYITSSIVPGFGQKQDDDLLHNYTVGKAIETVDWGTMTETVEYLGQEVKVYLLAVVYTSG